MAVPPTNPTAIGATILVVNLTVNTSLNGKTAVVLTNSGGTMTANLLDAVADIPSTAETGGFFAPNTPKVQCTSCTFWSMGFKTEISNPMLSLTNATGEVIGGFHLPNRAQVDNNALVFLNNSRFSGTWSQQGPNSYPNWVSETRNGTTKTLAAGTYLNLFYSDAATTVAHPYSVAAFGNVSYLNVTVH